MRRLAQVAALLLLGGCAGASNLPVPTPEVTARPLCRDQGSHRLAVMVPPGREPAEVRSTLLTSGLIAPEVEIAVISDVPALQHRAATAQALERLLGRLSDAGLRVEGTLTSVLLLDADGRIERVRSGGDPRVSDLLVEFWSQQTFEPVVSDGCRVPAWIQAPLQFVPKPGGGGVHISIGAPREPA